MPVSAARALPCGTRYALYFDGVSSYVEVLDSPSIHTFSSMTITIMFRTIRRYQAFIRKAVTWPPSPGDWGLWMDRYGNIYFQGVTVEGTSFYVIVASPANWNENVWNELAVRWDGTNIYSFINGAMVRGPFSLTGTLSNDAPLYIGYGVAPRYLGEFAKALIHSYGLSGREIRWNFNYRDNPVRNGLIMWLHWDSIDISAGKWYDKTVFANHGTIYGATLAEPIRLKARILSPVRSLSPAR